MTVFYVNRNKNGAVTCTVLLVLVQFINHKSCNPSTEGGANLLFANDLEVVPYRTPQRPRLLAMLFETRGTLREGRLCNYVYVL